MMGGVLSGLIARCEVTRTQLLPEIFKLSANDQLMIAEAIRNHLVGGVVPVDEAEFRAELDRRAKDADQNPADEGSLEDVLLRLKSKR